MTEIKAIRVCAHMCNLLVILVHALLYAKSILNMFKKSSYRIRTLGSKCTKGDNHRFHSRHNEHRDHYNQRRRYKAHQVQFQL